MCVQVSGRRVALTILQYNVERTQLPCSAFGSAVLSLCVCSLPRTRVTAKTATRLRGKAHRRVV
jgi:hypothetical protein